ncbi:MAG: pyridoxamine 5'-phosphate oxidase family protein [Nocardioides sp.]
MAADPPRTREQRKADALAMLQADNADVWVASACIGDSGMAEPYLVPVSLAWVDDCAVIAIPTTSRTFRNLGHSGRARLGVGPTRDLVMLDVVVGGVEPVDASSALAARFAAQADWDPRSSDDDYSLVVLRPERIQAWREVDEMPGRMLMRNGEWTV